MTSLIIQVLILFTFVASSFADSCPTFTTQANFKIIEVLYHRLSWQSILINLFFQYLGFWYQVEGIPNIFQPGTKCDNATYTLNSDGTVDVFNQAINAQGQYQSFRGVAKVVDPNIPAAFILTSDTSKYSLIFLWSSLTTFFYSKSSGLLQYSWNGLQEVCCCVFLSL